MSYMKNAAQSRTGGSYSERKWLALWHLFRRPYFTRLWIVQEIVLARQWNTYYFCGTYVAEATDFETVGKSMVYTNWRREIAEVPSDSVQRPLDPGYAATDFFRVIDGLRGPSYKGRLIMMDLLIEVVQHQKALEPLDRVYGILGILPEKWRQRLKVDYSDRSKENHLMVWADFVKILIPGTDGRIFGRLESEQPKPLGLPSWCPDLSCPSRPYISIEYHAGGIFEAVDRPDKEDPSVSMYSAPGSNAIQIEGAVVDVVLNVYPLVVPDILIDRPDNGDLAQPWTDFTDSLINVIDMVVRELAPTVADDAEQGTSTASSTPYCTSFCSKFDFGDDVASERTGDLLLEQAALTNPAQRATFASLTRALAAISAKVKYDFDTTITGLTITHLMLLDALHVLPVACRNASPAGRLTRLPVWGEEEGLPPLINRICEMGRGRCVFTTRAGRVGLGPRAMATGDSVVVFFGAPTGYVLRGAKPWIGCTMVGQCFLDGIMDAELYAPDYNVEEFALENSTIFCIV